MKKVISLILVFTLCLMMAPTTKVKAVETMSMLHTEGNKIVDAEGEQITLRGTNLGGWLMQEGWLSPLGNGEIDHAYMPIPSNYDDKKSIKTNRDVQNFFPAHPQSVKDPMLSASESMGS